jgi:hypothetical protein
MLDMLSLRELQTDFATALGVAPPRSDEPPAPIPQRLADHIAASALSREQRVQVYRNNYQSSLREALGSIYPVVRQLVGEGFFSWLAHEFVTHHPSTSGNLHDFGATLEPFLRDFEAVSAYPYLPDVAALEWAWHCAFHAAEHGPLDLAALAAVPAHGHESLTLVLHPSAGLLSGVTPFVSIWRAHQSDDEVEPIEVEGVHESALVLRASADVAVIELDYAEFKLLSALREGTTFGRACEEAAATDPQFDFAACIERHVALGTLADFCVLEEHQECL